MRKEPDNQSSGKATAKIDCKTAAAYALLRGNEDPYDSASDSAYHFFLFRQDPDSTQSVYAFDTTDEESDTDDSVTSLRTS